MGWWDTAVCEKCGLKYKDMTTGLTFKDVKQMMFDNSPDPADWKYKRRHTVLGYWHELKLQLWEEHVRTCKGETE